MLGGKRGKQRISATLTSDINVRNGDKVSLVLEPRHLLRASVLVYGYPLLGAVIAASLAWFAGLGDVASAIAALLGLVAGFAVARVRLQSASCLREFTPIIERRLEGVN